MKRVRWVTAVLLLLTLALALAGCAGKSGEAGGGQTGPKPAVGAGTPEAKALDVALVALGQMVDAGKKEDWATAKTQYDTVGKAFDTLKTKLRAKDPTLTVRIEQALEETGGEFQPGRTPRAFEFSEEGVKISKLLVDVAGVLELPFVKEHVIAKLDVVPPFKQEIKVDVVLKDYAIVPEKITAPQNSKLVLHVKNDGPHEHEMEVAHYEQEVRLKPGESTDLIIYTLEAGEFELSCHMPGHYEVGMKGLLSVTK